MRTVIYPGSFDPFTNGHLDLVQRAAKLFDRVIVAVARNEAKGPLFAVEERLDLVRQSIKSLPNVSAEADILFSQSNYSNTTNGRLQSSSYMGNLIYHLPMDGPFQVYGGAGLGAVNTNIDNGLGNHGGSTVLGWQLLGGVEYRASEQASLFAEYRYQNAHDVNAGGFTRVSDTGNHLSLGVKWHLD